MTRCPKCGGNNIAGPFYHCASSFAPGKQKEINLAEALEYRCACGYSKLVPCLDHVAEQNAQLRKQIP